MKLKALCVVVLRLFFVGCADRAPSTPNFSVSVSQPIFITNFKNLDANASNKTAYVFFKNSSGYQNNLESAVRNKLSILGFSQSFDMQNADIAVLGDFVSLERYEHRVRREPRVFMDMGYGWGSRGYRSRSVGVGMIFGSPFYDDDWDYPRTDYYVYKAVVSVMIRANGQEQRANIELSSGENLYSPSYILPFVEERVAKQILNFFY